uniref:Na+/alanine symporter n=1 Tax=uncultured Verrucomicrobiales bacterium HF0130_14P10 TaxID=723606 RepID=E7C2N3_9BACT|nr:Na+/alanine symporter [uncultured Verrucomicrobiales bacterium HF0130_14P10]
MNRFRLNSQPSLLALSCLILSIPSVLLGESNGTKIVPEETNTSIEETVLTEQKKQGTSPPTSKALGNDFRIRITHDKLDKKTFKLELQAKPSAKSTEPSLDQRINSFIAPITDTISSLVFWAPAVPDLQLEIVADSVKNLNIPQNSQEDGIVLEVLPGLTIENLKEQLQQRSKHLRVKGVLPDIRPLENRAGSKNNWRSAANGKFVVPCQSTVPAVVLWLVTGAIIFTLYLRFVNFRYFRLAIDIVCGKHSDPTDKGEVSHFQALSAALSGTVGLGNIAGVAVAISLGGPGATFWMIIAGLLGMSSKFVECTLGVKYRKFGEDGRTYGGPMYYLRDGLAKRGWGKMGKIFAIFFAVMCVGGSLGGGNMFQINQAFAQFVNVTGGPQESWAQGYGWLFGLVVAALVAMVIIGGIRSIARATSKIVPLMCGIYVLAAIVVLIARINEVPGAFALILSEAFNPQAVTGGFVGVLIQGFKRAAFSNEAGIGSASIAHSAVRTKFPASEGLVSLLEPFIDTVVVCTMTALVIVVTGQWEVGASSFAEGVSLTSDSFESVIGWFPLLLTLAVLLFAFSTMITWSYYGQQAWAFVFGRGRQADLTYKLIFCLCIILGSAMSLDKVIGFSDAMIFAMCFPNLIGLYFLMPEARRELAIYLSEIRKGRLAAPK